MNVSPKYYKNLINTFIGSCGTRYKKTYLSTVSNDFNNTCAIINDLISKGHNPTVNE